MDVIGKASSRLMTVYSYLLTTCAGPRDSCKGVGVCSLKFTCEQALAWPKFEADMAMLTIFPRLADAPAAAGSIIFELVHSGCLIPIADEIGPDLATGGSLPGDDCKIVLDGEGLVSVDVVVGGGTATIVGHLPFAVLKLPLIDCPIVGGISRCDVVIHVGTIDTDAGVRLIGVGPGNCGSWSDAFDTESVEIGVVLTIHKNSSATFLNAQGLMIPT